jgi:S-adenosylmethionine synthetase
MKGDFIFTSESVTEGHPDKLCDQISDALVDRFLVQDPFAQITAECAVATGILFIAARFAAEATVDIPGVARRVVAEAGYERNGFDPKTCSIMTSLNEIPPGERQLADERDLDDAEIERIPAHNQTTVFGYACTQTPELMPLPIWLCHKLARRLAEMRNGGELPYLAPDGKTQVAVEYAEGRPKRIHGLSIIAALNADRVPSDNRLRDDLIESVVRPAFADEPVAPDPETAMFFNPGGTFLVGGPAMHAGLTGRKNGVDTYGEYARQGESALSGKDPSRIDRVGAYAARYAAKNVVAAGLADECEVQLCYTIGQSRPVSMRIETFGTGSRADGEIAARVAGAIDFRPAGIVRRFQLRHLPGIAKGWFYRRLSAYGHVGRTDMALPWEETDLTAVLAD